MTEICFFCDTPLEVTLEPEDNPTRKYTHCPGCQTNSMCGLGSGLDGLLYRTTEMKRREAKQ